MTTSAHKTEGVNRTKKVRFYPFVFTSTGEGGIAAYYNYTADGERNIKLTSPRLNMHQNASLFNNPPLFIPTLYASPLITLTPKGYTKHYFEEGRRVCSKLGGWFLWRVPADDILKPVEEVKNNYEEQHNQQRQGVHETFGKCIGAWPELIDKYDLLKMLLEYKNEEKNFYYHSDHLGSAAYLTSGGDVTQTLNYLPYGEDWIDVQNNMDPRLGQYRFNGKEKDYESGFHYYGARYYWSEVLTGWLSVDPMADKYPSISPYAYCIWNPVKLVDPDGFSSDDPPLRKYGKEIVKIGIKLLNHGYKKTHPKILSDNIEATAHYYLGKGKPIGLTTELGDKLVQTKDFQKRHRRIVQGKTTSLSGNFAVDMTLVDPTKTFFIGDTRVDYIITVSDDKKTCTVTYTLFSHDGFYDPNFVAEECGNAARACSFGLIDFLKADGEGNNLELGGIPYNFIPQKRMFKFKNPGYVENQ